MHTMYFRRGNLGLLGFKATFFKHKKHIDLGKTLLFHFLSSMFIEKWLRNPEAPYLSHLLYLVGKNENDTA